VPEVVELAPELENTQTSESAPAPEVVPTPVHDDLPDWLKNFAPVSSESSSSNPTSNTEEDVF
jgi:hypothetical protein